MPGAADRHATRRQGGAASPRPRPRPRGGPAGTRSPGRSAAGNSTRSGSRRSPAGGSSTRCGCPTPGSSSADKAGKVKVARHPPPAGEAARLGPCFVLASREPGAAGLLTLQVIAVGTGSGQPPLTLEQQVLVTDGPTVFAPGLVDVGDLAGLTGFELRHKRAGARGAVGQPGPVGGVQRRGGVQAAPGLRLVEHRRGRAGRAAGQADGRGPSVGWAPPTATRLHGGRCPPYVGLPPLPRQPVVVLVGVGLAPRRLPVRLLGARHSSGPRTARTRSRHEQARGERRVLDQPVAARCRWRRVVPTPPAVRPPPSTRRRPTASGFRAPAM